MNYKNAINRYPGTLTRTETKKKIIFPLIVLKESISRVKNLNEEKNNESFFYAISIKYIKELNKKENNRSNFCLTSTKRLRSFISKIK